MDSFVDRMNRICKLKIAWDCSLRRNFARYWEALRNQLLFQSVGGLYVDPAELPSQTYKLGDFEIVWDRSRGGQLRISHHQQPHKILWSSLQGRGFVAAAQAKERVRESRGHFRIKDRVSLICAEQHISQIGLTDTGLTITGRLSSADRRSWVGYTFSFAPQGSAQLEFVLSFDDPHYNRSYFTYTSASDECFFGFGTQYSFFNLKGKRVPIFVQEQGIGRGLQPLTLAADLQAGAGGAWHTSYACVPHYISSKLRSLFLTSTEYAVFDLRHSERVQIQVFAGEIRGRIVSADSPTSLIDGYTQYTGRMSLLPDWVHQGAIVGLQGGTQRVRHLVQQLQAEGVTIAAVWLQDWVGQRQTSFGSQLWWNWELDRQHYPDWEALVDDLHDQGIRLLTYVNPYLVDASKKPGMQRNLFQEAAERGYLIRRSDGSIAMSLITDFSASLVDLSNPEAYAWLKDVMLRQLLETGVDGWMADFGEGLPYDARLHSGESAASYHNHYPEIWARLQHDIIQASGRAEQLLVFMRSGYTRSPAYAQLFWLGDQLVSWDAQDGIKTAVIGLLSSGISGFSLNHSDIGGYTSIMNPLLNYRRSKEFLMRWIELNAFSCVFRSHEGNRPEHNVQVYSDHEIVAHFSRFAAIYRALAPYRRELVREAATTGLPVVRHPFIHYPRDARVYQLSYQQFMLGSQLMIVPVLDAGAVSVQAYLPEGDWIHLWSGRLYHATPLGLTVRVAAPIGEPGVFYKAESAVAAELVEQGFGVGV